MPNTQSKLAKLTKDEIEFLYSALSKTPIKGEMAGAVFTLMEKIKAEHIRLQQLEEKGDTKNGIK